MGESAHIIIQVKGLAQLNRDLKKWDKDLSREIGRYFRVLGKDLRDKARGYAPSTPGRYYSPRQRGEGHPGLLEKSIKHSVTQKKISLYSKEPYAPVHEWGGTIRPRGVPIRIRKTQMLGRAIGESEDEIVKHIEGLPEHLAKYNGFH